MANTQSLLEKIQKRYFDNEFRALGWQGTFQDYLEIVRKDPKVLRTAYQRLYDMVMSYGTEEYEAIF